MPKVSDAHLDARRRQILDAARRCFASKGVHRTTMQDLFAESGLSAGAVYRYFKSRDEIVSAIADEAIPPILKVAESALEEEPLPRPEEFLRRLLELAERLLAPEDGRGKIAVQIWGDAAVDERARGFAASKYVPIRGYFVEYAERAMAAGLLPPGADPEMIGKTMFGLVPGFILQRLILRDVDAASYATGLAGLLGAEAAAGIRG
jgi:AcrR family transcriptional regulator